jgi:hypothetical protein
LALPGRRALPDHEKLTVNVFIEFQQLPRK